MKKYILLVSFILLFTLTAFAQNKESKGYLKFGTGIYWDISRWGVVDNFADPNTGLKPKATVSGQPLWLEGAVKLNNGMFVSANILYVSLNRKYLDLIYQNQKYQYVIKNYTLSLGYEFNIGKHQKFMPQLGLLYYRNKASLAKNDIVINNGVIQSIAPFIDNVVDEEIGQVLNLDYYYQFKNNFFLGVRANVTYVLGFEGITFTPVLGVKF